MKYKVEDDYKYIDLSGKVLLWQNDKRITGSKASYNQKDDLFSIRHNVEIELADLQWLLDKSEDDPFENQDINDAITMATMINCDLLTFDANNQILKLSGNIKITQNLK